MQKLLKEENGIDYAVLLGSRKSFSGHEDDWLDSYAGKDANELEVNPNSRNWAKSCIDAKNPMVAISFIGDFLLCGFHGESDKKIREAIRCSLSNRFFTDCFNFTLADFKSEELTKLEKEFNELASRWYRETRKISSAEQIVLNPSYQKIIGMGKDALPFIFRELQKSRGHWLWALAMILRDDKAKPGMNFREAVDAWLEWGETNGYIYASTGHTRRYRFIS